MSFGKAKSTEGNDGSEPVIDGSKKGAGEAASVKDENNAHGQIMNGVLKEDKADEDTSRAEGAEQEESMSIDQEGAGSAPGRRSHNSPKRSQAEMKGEEDDEEEEPVLKRSRKEKLPAPSSRKDVAVPSMASPKPNVKSESPKSSKNRRTKQETPIVNIKEESNCSPNNSKRAKAAEAKPEKNTEDDDEDVDDQAVSEQDDDAESEEDEKPEVAAKAREKVQSTLKSSGKDPYPDWKPGEPVPYAALCTTFSLIEMTTKRLVISAHCSLFLRQVLRLTPQDLLPTVQLMINKLAADYAGIELGIGESLIMKAIGETTGRSLQVIKADQNEIGDLGLVAAKSRGNQPTMFKPKPLTVRGVLEGLMAIATTSGGGSQGLKIAGIKKLLSAADATKAGKGIDITQDKGGPSEAKFIIRFLEGKLRLGLAEKTVLVAIAHAMVMHETGQKGEKVPSSEKLAQGEAILKTVYRYAILDAFG